MPPDSMERMALCRFSTSCYALFSTKSLCDTVSHKWLKINNNTKKPRDIGIVLEQKDFPSNFPKIIIFPKRGEGALSFESDNLDLFKTYYWYACSHVIINKCLYSGVWERKLIDMQNLKLNCIFY